jgi:hypothetical protein
MTKTITTGSYARLYQITEDGETLYVVKEHDHDVSETFWTLTKALLYFEHTERYEAAQARKGRR